MVVTEGYPAPLGLRLLGSSLTQGVALGYPISPLRGCSRYHLPQCMFDSTNIEEAHPLRHTLQNRWQFPAFLDTLNASHLLSRLLDVPMYSLLCLALLSPALPAHDAASELLPPGITMDKAFQGWIALYDGETNYGWKTTGEVKIEKGILTAGGEKEASLTTTSYFDAFEVVIEYRLEGGKGSFSVKSGDGLAKHSEKQTPAGDAIGTFTLKSPTSAKSGPIVIAVEAGTMMHIKSITLRPLGTKSIFNGKDLDGWKEIPGKKSKFTVTSAGEINVKNGNGDLQTIDQWDDFVMQADIISNGDHLNSGIFFRCLPGEFWSGYEAQVRNEWQTTIKLKDGKSHTGSMTMIGDKVGLNTGRQKLSFTKSEIESITDHRDKPIDFGSGGIYHHCPARKVVSTDREWYTMTVVAHGNHLAVWVNGYQTAEFTDNRPMNRNARNGRKDAAGCLSIQGHDPTTDLNFKNIRIAPLVK